MSAPKRPAPPSQPNVDPPPPSLKKPRRNPALSCQLCRIKKIKCSRVFPCSNCVTRNVECIPQDASAISMSSPNNSSHSSTHNNQFYARWEGSAERSYGRSGPETSGMLSRPGSGTPNAEQKPLNPRRSFESSFRVNPDDDRTPSGICMLSMVASREAQIQDQDSIKTANFLEELAMGHQGGRPFNPEPPPLRPPAEQAANRGQDGPSKVRIAEWARFLQEMLIPGKPNSPPDVTAVEHTPVALLPPTIQKPLHPYHENSLSRLRFFGSPKPQTLEHVLRQLPPEPRTRQLLGNFFELVHPFTQIVHAPTVLLYVDEVYRNGNALDTETLASVLSLLFTLMAVGAHHWPPAKSADLELTGAPPGQTALTAQHAALESLELANYMSCPTLETIQSCVLLPFVQRTSEDWAAARNIRGLTVKMCQTLGLHKLPDVSKLPESRILYDVRRRLWWYIASSDWLHSSLGGAHQHTYLISASHLHTSFPSHYDDIDLSTYTTFPKPPSDPTDMSFFLARSQLADITRAIVDTFNTPTHSYDTLLTHDTRLQTWLKTLPPFFRAHKPPPTTPIRPYIPWQRTLLTVMANDLLLRLHAPYMIRGSQEPRYAHSRMTILRAAHTLLRTYRHLYSDPSYPPLLRALAGIHTLFQAVLLLSIDLFCNEDEPHAEETRKQLVDACDLMERVRIQSSVADEGIGTLFAIVRRWREGCGVEEGGEEEDAAGEGVISGWGEVLEWRGLEGEEFLDWSGLVREVGGCEGDAGWC